MNPQLQKILLMMETLGEDIGLDELRKLTLTGDWRKLGTSIVTEKYLRQFITQDPKMLQLKEDVRKCSCSDYPVMIVGETGTGKELIAQALHGGRNGPFKGVNVTNLPSELLESELFGHVRGAFTGAVNDKAGLFQAAGDGTLFLDEIGDLPLDMQAKLLRVIQDKKARRLGSNEEFTVKCRIVSATNVIDIENSKKFRPDLYYRLAVLVLKTTPLRERLGDVRLILDALDKDAEKKFPRDFQWYKEADAGTVYTSGADIVANHLAGNVRSIQRLVWRFQVLERVD